jgi:hypothetical protein
MRGRVFLLVLFAFKQGVFKDVTEGQNALQLALLVYYDEAVDTGFTDGVVDGA